MCERAKGKQSEHIYWFFKTHAYKYTNPLERAHNSMCTLTYIIYICIYRNSKRLADVQGGILLRLLCTLPTPKLNLIDN